jgi:hypothetical protein
MLLLGAIVTKDGTGIKFATSELVSVTAQSGVKVIEIGTKVSTPILYWIGLT